MEFSIQSLLSFGWQTFRKRPWFFVGATVVIALIYLIAGLIIDAIDYLIAPESEGRTPIGSVLDLGLNNLITMGVTAFYLDAHDSPETVTLSSIWHLRPFWKFLGATVLASLAVILGLVLLIVPGIIFMLMFMFADFIVIDRELGPIEAMKESARITRGYRWVLLGFALITVLINVLGLLALVVGFLVAVPVTSLAFVHAYRVLQARSGMPRAISADAKL
jgi:uncharacterized membrane protein